MTSQSREVFIDQQGHQLHRNWKTDTKPFFFNCSTTHLCIGKKLKLDTVRVPVNFYNPWTDLLNIMIRIIIHSFDSENNLVDFCNIKM